MSESILKDIENKIIERINISKEFKKNGKEAETIYYIVIKELEGILDYVKSKSN